VAVRGTEVSVRYGRIGSPGQTNTRTFPDAAAAAGHAAKLIREKSAKGYTEVP
jgi:predicted DNA-binding WGR domain protein